MVSANKYEYVHTACRNIVFVSGKIYNTMYGRDQNRTTAGQPCGEGQCRSQAHLCKLSSQVISAEVLLDSFVSILVIARERVIQGSLLFIVQ